MLAASQARITQELQSEAHVFGEGIWGETHPAEKLLAPAVCANVFQVSRRATA